MTETWKEIQNSSPRHSFNSCISRLLPWTADNPRASFASSTLGGSNSKLVITRWRQALAARQQSRVLLFGSLDSPLYPFLFFVFIFLILNPWQHSLSPFLNRACVRPFTGCKMIVWMCVWSGTFRYCIRGLSLWWPMCNVLRGLKRLPGYALYYLP